MRALEMPPTQSRRADTTIRRVIRTQKTPRSCARRWFLAPALDWNRRGPSKVVALPENAPAALSMKSV